MRSRSLIEHTTEANLHYLLATCRGAYPFFPVIAAMVSSKDRPLCFCQLLESRISNSLSNWIQSSFSSLVIHANKCPPICLSLVRLSVTIFSPLGVSFIRLDRLSSSSLYSTMYPYSLSLFRIFVPVDNSRIAACINSVLRGSP